MRKILLIIGTILIIFLGIVGGYTYYFYKTIENTVNNEMHVSIDREKSEKREIEVDLKEKDPLSFLLLGVDEREADRGRSDTLMVITVNPNDDSMKMLSIPRDTRTEIIGRGTIEKINHAYAYGGPEMVIHTVENFLDIPIDYFTTVNMEGFIEIVDAIGGIHVYNDMDFEFLGHHFEEGEIFLDGEAALAYSRMRYEDPKGDLGRNERQRQIITSIISEGAQLPNIMVAGEILETLGTNIATNLTFPEIKSIVQGYRSVIGNSETLEIEGYGQIIDGIWYYIVSDEERKRVSQQLQNHLQMTHGDGSTASSKIIGGH